MAHKHQQTEESSAQSAVALPDFMSTTKLKAFLEQYEPLDHWSEDCDMFNDSQLRAYFKAVVCPLGDPLSIYLDTLELHGFHMHSDESGEPVLYCRRK